MACLLCYLFQAFFAALLHKVHLDFLNLNRTELHWTKSPNLCLFHFYLKSRLISFYIIICLLYTSNRRHFFSQYNLFPQILLGYSRKHNMTFTCYTIVFLKIHVFDDFFKWFLHFLIQLCNIKYFLEILTLFQYIWSNCFNLCNTDYVFWQWNGPFIDLFAQAWKIIDWSSKHKLHICQQINEGSKQERRFRTRWDKFILPCELSTTALSATCQHKEISLRKADR